MNDPENPSNRQESSSDDPPLAVTPLGELHAELEARMVPFAGWSMPIQFEGVIAEHRWTRSSASLFDVSHMATVEIRGDDPGASLERLTPAGMATLAEGRQRYGLLTNDDGGIIDDLMAANWGDHITVVVNASRADVDLPHLRSGLPGCEVVHRTDLALLALQGPAAATVIGRLTPDLDDTVFLDVRPATIDGIPVRVSRSGYTGEDGFEISVAAERADELARLLLAAEEVRPAGLGARDTLRLEAGLHLYGNDLDETISPIEADLGWTIPKRRREAADFPGATRILRERDEGPARLRVGLRPAGKRPVRDHTSLRSIGSETVGVVTSGGYGPSLEAPIAMALVDPRVSEIETELIADVRGNDVRCVVSPLPFHPHRYARS